MATVAEIRVPAATFALRGTFERCPDAEFDVVRSAASTGDGSSSLVWVSGPDAEAVGSALADDPSVDSAVPLEDLSDRRLYRLRWSNRASVVLSLLLHDAVAIEMIGVAGRWHFEIIFPDRDALSAAYALSEELGVDVDVENIYALSEGHYRTFDLTEKQRDTLSVAHELGYFKIPREVSLDELASRIGISRQAISERLRRAHDALIHNTLRSRDAPVERGERGD